MDVFIDAEEAAGRSVTRCCELFELSRAAYYERRKQTPSQRDRDDAELLERIRRLHDESKGTYGSPRG
jgi:hypothetical protein